ncbi:MAG: energy transducer TonB [Bacteroidota bacterium]
MKKICVFLCLLHVCYTKAQKKQLEHAPTIHEYVYVEKEPKLLNYEEVKKMIGYPIKALKNNIEGKVYCRILVDEEGKYSDHVITRRAHPILMEAVRSHISKLQFIPASKNHQKIPYWVNVPFVFSHRAVPNKLWRRSPVSNLHMSQVIGGLKKSREYMNIGDDLLHQANYLQAKTMYEKALSTNPSSLVKNSEATKLLFQAHAKKAQAEILAGLWEPAFESLTHAISTERSLPEEIASKLEDDILQVYIFRSREFLRRREPMKALDDCLWVMKNSQSRELQAQAYAHKGLVNLKLGRIQAAFTDIQESIDLDPSYPEPYYFKALVLIHLQGYQVATPLLEEAIVLGLANDDLKIAESLLHKYSQIQE